MTDTEVRGPALAGWKPTPLPHDDVPAGFHVPYTIKPATCGFGVGLFAVCDIPKGTLLWKYRGGPQGTPGVNVWTFDGDAASRARLAELTPEEQIDWLEHVYLFEASGGECGERVAAPSSFRMSRYDSTVSIYAGHTSAGQGQRDSG